MPSQNTSNTAASLPAQMEIFRAGQHIDDSGVVHNFSAADVTAMARCYEPTLRESPLTIGHPADNLPAWGWVKGLADRDGTLLMHAHQVQPQFAEMVDKKLFKKRSSSFYPPQHPNNPKPGHWYLRHVAFLGAQQPAIAGLADFAEGKAPNTSAEDGTVNFSEPLFNQEQIRMSKELQDQLTASQTAAAIADKARQEAEAVAADATAKLAQFAEAQKRERVAGFASFCEEQIKGGTLLPKEKDAAVAVMTTLADAQEVSFAEGGATKTVAAVDFLKSLIQRAKPAVSFGEHAAAAGGSNGLASKEMDDAQVDKLAKDYAAKHNVNYAEALSKVTVSFTS